MPWRSTSSATLKASCRLARLLTICSKRSLGMTIRVSTCSLSLLIPSSAVCTRFVPSKVKGRVTTPMVRAPISRAAWATMGEAPVPVPPPMPAVMKTISAPFRVEYSSLADSSAALRPTSGSPPEPNPRVSLSPMRIWVDAFDRNKACASVFTATNSTP